MEVVKLLLLANANVEAQNNNGWTPLNSAASDGHMEVVQVVVAGERERRGTRTITDGRP